MSVQYRTADEWWEHNRRCDEEAEREHGEDSHDCHGEAPCYGDPECRFAPCPGCGAPNGKCVCDVLYMKAHDK